MSKLIYKYLLNTDSNEWTFNKPYFDIELPADHLSLSAVSQNGMLHIYVAVDPVGDDNYKWTKEKVKRRFFVIHTGEPMPIDSRFLGTCVLLQKKYDKTDYVVHVFEGPVVGKAVKPINSIVSCNRHSDCVAADAAIRAENKRNEFGMYITRASHCYDDCCEECFGY